MMLESLLPVIIGGLLGLGGSIITACCQSRETKKSLNAERRRYKREKAENLYLELAALLGTLTVSIQIDGEICVADKEYFDEQLSQLSQVIEKNKGVAALYLPREISNELMFLNSEILQLISDEERQRIDMSNKEAIMQSPAFKIVTHAQRILEMLKAA